MGEPRYEKGKGQKGEKMTNATQPVVELTIQALEAGDGVLRLAPRGVPRCSIFRPILPT
jgi:hypothetical protein